MIVKLLSICGLFLLAACSTVTEHTELCRFDERIPSMGTFFEIQTVEPCQAPKIKTLKTSIKTLLDEIETELSLYQTESAIMRLNRAGSLTNPPPHMRKLLAASQDAGHKTNGIFDISILPVLKEIENSFEKTGRPPRNLERLRSLVNFKNVILNDDAVQFDRPGMQISFDGIAKGYAVDLVSVRLEELGIRNYLVNFSGNMRWKGYREDGEAWKIAVRNPTTGEAFRVERNEGAISTSGSEHVFYSDDKAWHHIIDPRTLRPPRLYTSATAIGPSAMICDILSTTFFIGKEPELKELLKKSFPEYSYFILTPDKKILYSGPKLEPL